MRATAYGLCNADAVTTVAVKMLKRKSFFLLCYSVITILYKVMQINNVLKKVKTSEVFCCPPGFKFPSPVQRKPLELKNESNVEVPKKCSSSRGHLRSALKASRLY